jgi:hypothetical protein
MIGEAAESVVSVRSADMPSALRRYSRKLFISAALIAWTWMVFAAFIH